MNAAEFLTRLTTAAGKIQAESEAKSFESLGEVGALAIIPGPLGTTQTVHIERVGVNLDTLDLQAYTSATGVPTVIRRVLIGYSAALALVAGAAGVIVGSVIR